MGSPVPLVMVVLFLSIAIGWRAWLQWRLHGTSGIVVFRSPGAFSVVRDAGLVLLPAALVGLGAAAWLAPAALAWIGPVEALEGAGAQRAGVAICAAAVALIVTAQVQMGRSWRVGIDEGARPGLVTHGLFAFCRNPIYIGMWSWHAGFVLLVPTWGNAGLLAVVVAGVSLQVRREEAYLLESYGDQYRAYAARTGRFVPGLGRLRP